MNALLLWYGEVNLLMVLTGLLWALLRHLSRWQWVAPGARQQLYWARRLLEGAALLAVITALFALLPAARPTPIAEEWMVTAGVQQAWAATRNLIALPSVAAGLIVLLLAGWGWQLLQVARLVARLRRVVKAATLWKQSGTVSLLISDEVTMPFATAVAGGNCIVLPASLLSQPQYWRLALRHELQHVRNGDLQWVVLLELLKVFCWWNPAAYWWQREFEILHELACDEALIVNRHVDTKAYGNCLLEVASSQTLLALPATTAMVGWPRWFRNQQSLLKRRIEHMQTLKKETNAPLKSALHGVLLGAGLFGCSLLVLAAEAQPGTDAGQSNIVPVSRVNPDYPLQAITEKRVGWVQLEFDIDADGSVTNATVMQSCAGTSLEQCTLGDQTFADSALTALRKWKYEAVGRQDVQTIMRFQLAQ